MAEFDLIVDDGHVLMRAVSTDGDILICKLAPDEADEMGLALVDLAKRAALAPAPSLLLPGVSGDR